MSGLINLRVGVGLAFVAAVLTACTTTATIPNSSQANLAANKMQFAVGTARIGQDNTVGLNFVATLRQPDGLSGVLADSPTITGPAGFVVPNAASGAYTFAGANLDAGTNHISSSPQVPLSNKNLVNTTLGTFTGIFSYGLGPFNSDQSTVSGAYYPGNPNNTGGNGFTSSTYEGSSMVAQATGTGDAIQPLPFLSADPMDYITGPPAVAFFNNGTYPALFAGYSPGFTAVEIAPIAGAYSLSVKVAAQNAAPYTYNRNATLSTTTALAAIPTPTFTEDGTGGGTGTVTIPAGVTETMVYIVDAPVGGTAVFYAIGPIMAAGAQPFALPDNLGPCAGVGCQNGAGANQSIHSGDSYFVSAVGFDYPAFQSAPPNNASQTPSITGANGQADITMSPVLTGTY
jgi:hypothetical protein